MIHFLQISVTLKEWDIPYSQLEVGELIGVGRFGTVYKLVLTSFFVLLDIRCL
jgi:hypothetical protein